MQEPLWEEDDNSPKIDPRIVIGICIGLMVLTELAKWYWPL
ncbi:MAG: preprotein translocase subunit Sec61beta [Thermoplasmatota archaeon]